jgi:hypothetical protein
VQNKNVDIKPVLVLTNIIAPEGLNHIGQLEIARNDGDLESERALALVHRVIDKECFYE